VTAEDHTGVHAREERGLSRPALWRPRHLETGIEGECGTVRTGHGRLLPVGQAPSRETLKDREPCGEEGIHRGIGGTDPDPVQEDEQGARGSSGSPLGHSPEVLLLARSQVHRDLDLDVAQERSVNLDECAEVSKGLEPWLDGHEEVPEAYTLEVSSPGVERPLTRSKDFVRFAGREIAVKGPEVLAGRATYLEGELIGLDEEPEGPGTIRLRLPGGEEVAISRDEISGARLIFRWE